MSALTQWWHIGGAVMPLLLGTALVLYVVVIERAWALFGPTARRGARRGEIARLLTGGDTSARVRAVATAEATELTRGLLLVRALTTALPLLGLLGTVIGMVEVFAALGGGTGAGGSPAVGISQALIATQYGLCLAIPGLLAEWLLRRRAERLAGDRERIAPGSDDGSGSP